MAYGNYSEDPYDEFEERRKRQERLKKKQKKRRRDADVIDNDPDKLLDKRSKKSSKRRRRKSDYLDIIEEFEAEDMLDDDIASDYEQDE